MQPMKLPTIRLALLTAVLAGTFGLHTAQADTFGSGTNIFTIDFVEVGDAGNANDTTGYGGVSYDYRMGTYEISRDMITKANTVSAIQGQALNLSLLDMSAFGGNGVDRPATGISWNEAARFVNWLNTSQGYQAAYKFALQPGDVGYSSNANILLWEPADAGYNASNLYRNADAFYFLPSEDEWYKAAYYSGSGSVYFDYATQQNVGDAPTAVASGTGADEAVYDGQSGPADITLAGGESHYGTVGQNGNVWEWQESAFTAPNDSATENRGIRGGAWDGPEISLRSSDRIGNSPTFQFDDSGFRVASVPEPTGGALLLAAGGAWLLRRRRRSSL